MPDPLALAPRPLVDGAEPKHAQLRAVLASMCATELAPDAAIPSERELMTAYAVSRATVRRAIESLVAEGALRRVQGKGTFVAPPRVQSHLHLASFTQDMRRGARRRRPASCGSPRSSRRPRWRPGSACDAGATAWWVERVRLAAGEPMAFEAGWYSPTLLPGLDRHDLARLALRAVRAGVRRGRRHGRADRARRARRPHARPPPRRRARATRCWRSSGAAAAAAPRSNG